MTTETPPPAPAVRRVAVDDVEIAVRGYGSGSPALLLVHGLGGSSKVWSGVAPLLARQSAVYAVDLRGCGSSTRGLAPWTLARAADDVAGAARALGLSRYVAVGHSLGGVIVQELLERHPDEVAAAVLVSTSSRLSDKATANWQRLAEIVEARGLTDSVLASSRGFAEDFAAVHPDVVAEQSRQAALADPKVYAEQARAASRYDYTESLAGVRCPVLVVQGLADRLTPPGGSVLLHRALPSGARLEMVDGAGHNLPIEMPGTLAELVLDFLRTLPVEVRAAG